MLFKYYIVNCECFCPRIHISRVILALMDYRSIYLCIFTQLNIHRLEMRFLQSTSAMLYLVKEVVCL